MKVIGSYISMKAPHAMGNSWRICPHTKIEEIDKRISDQCSANTKIYVKTLKGKIRRERENSTII